MSFTYNRTVRFQDTDAAGVVYFANVLVMCHEAYEDSLAKAGINLKTFFSHAAVAVPIIHSSVDFFQPMFCGDKLLIDGIPQRLSDSKFEIKYQVIDAASPQRHLADALTRHVCIDTNTRTKIILPDGMINWLYSTTKKR
ncbi:acyl-CoA thioesterase [Coleofasciculus sp. E2-BRE-01]|uniref:acyl-CoA thioesterase n=1 Tax=Coleofasciculus sp. E2-BRE-01 TaxID=3069524 RepID=UPI0032F9FA30